MARNVKMYFLFRYFLGSKKNSLNFLTGGMEVSFLEKTLTGDFLFWKNFKCQNAKKTHKRKHFDEKCPKKGIFW